ncbi:MAG: bifunctional hydroxymethylpyrimidine kinase/phosphomethylpyrimidine kinase [Chloroflexi bacterium]|nr:bifunctional hydroxymethylpyrimidine kinase/phosphomethylpyrimidine kinase [Chloroflexota bacterium]
MKRALTIAGSDSGGGAGIQADLKTFAARGVYGMSALTAITAQNTLGVQGVHELPPEFVALQIDSVMTDIGADAVKTGMIANSAIIAVVTQKIRKYQVQHLVVDPVMVAKGGDTLLRPEAKQALIEQLIPLAEVVTPNAHEAEALIGAHLESLDDMKRAAETIRKLGARNVVVKGGHVAAFPNESVDVLFDGSEFILLRAERIGSENTHGTGCTFASAIAAELAKGASVKDAAQTAKLYVTEAIRNAATWRLGRGHGPLNHFGW